MLLYCASLNTGKHSLSQTGAYLFETLGIYISKQLIDECFVYTGYKNNFNFTVLEVCQHTKPKVCSLIFLIYTPYVIPDNTQHIIDCTCNDTTTFIRYFIMDGIHPDYRIDKIFHAFISEVHGL